jgi:predicted RNA-binding Zn-ribbon protein involved in translation (DUF1610 family)
LSRYVDHHLVESYSTSSTSIILAREHDLSPHAPICRSCGLILCTVNLSHHACPHCSSLLLTVASRDTLVKLLATQISDLLTKEAEARQRIAEEARRAVGDFPPLHGGPSISRTGSPAPSNKTHKVLSLNSKTKKVTVSTYPTTPPAPSRASSPEDPEVIRVPPPPSEVVHAKAKPDHAHPWTNIRGPQAFYVPPTHPRIDVDESHKKTKTKTKGRANDIAE